MSSKKVGDNTYKKQASGSQAKKQMSQQDLLESLKGIGGGAVKSIRQDLLGGLPKGIGQQLMGRMPMPNRSGEIRPGESMEMSDVASGRREQEEKLRAQIAFERNLRRELEQMEGAKVRELKIQLNGLINEIRELANITPQLAQEVEIAAMQMPTNPGMYHVIFYEKLLGFVKSFRKEISSASEWMHESNSRASKKGGNKWGKNYKKHGAKYLLSGEHYLTRSAG